MNAFVYQDLFSLKDRDKDEEVSWHFLGDEYVQDFFVDNLGSCLKVKPEALTFLSERAFDDMAFLLRTSHLEQLASILKDAEASDNDRFVAMELLKNAVISSNRVFPLCQDTGTALVIAEKGENVFTAANDLEFISEGIHKAYTVGNLRYSQLAPLSLYKEQNTKNNLPAQIDISASMGSSYDFLFIAKGGGSANKSILYNKSKDILSKDKLLAFLKTSLKEIGTSACPPYFLSVVIGGLSGEHALKTLKLSLAEALDTLPLSGNNLGRAFRDRELEAELLKISQDLGIGAQFGGTYFCRDARVIRLPRHGASCFIAVGVSCSAHRNIRAKINSRGLFLERLEEDPASFLPDPDLKSDDFLSIDLNLDMADIASSLSRLKVGSRVFLNGPMIVARDMAHSRLKEILAREGKLPDYLLKHMVYYAGPAKVPPSYPSGSFGPTTSGRMDSYVPDFQKVGGSLLMLGKGNRSAMVKEACRTYGGFYLGSIGGAAAKLGHDCIKEVKLLDFEDLGMEAVYRIVVKDFPAFLIIDDKGNDFYEDILS